MGERISEKKTNNWFDNKCNLPLQLQLKARQAILENNTKRNRKNYTQAEKKGKKIV